MKKLYLFLTVAIALSASAQTNFSLLLDGTSGLVNIGTPNPNGSSYTKEAWIFPTSVAGPRNIISSLNSPLFLNGGPLDGGQGGSFSLVADPTTYTVNVWVHVALTYD